MQIVFSASAGRCLHCWHVVLILLFSISALHLSQTPGAVAPSMTLPQPDRVQKNSGFASQSASCWHLTHISPDRILHPHFLQFCIRSPPSHVFTVVFSQPFGVIFPVIDLVFRDFCRFSLAAFGL